MKTNATEPMHMCIDIPAGVFTVHGAWVDAYPITPSDVVDLVTFFEFGETYPIYYAHGVGKYVVSPDLFASMENIK